MGCRRRAPRAELIRLVRSDDGAVTIDSSAGAPGRGGYLCRRPECFNRARRRLVAGLRADRLAATLEDEFMKIVSEERS